LKPAFQRSSLSGFAALFALVVCAAALTVSGCNRTQPTRGEVIDRYSQDLRDEISSEVPDQARKAQMLLVVDHLEAVHRRFSEETVSFIERYRTLNADYDATRPAFDQLFSDYKTKRVKARSEALDLHFQLASLASADEWSGIWKAEKKLYEKVNETDPTQENKK
jgi:hypothetical protein